MKRLLPTLLLALCAAAAFAAPSPREAFVAGVVKIQKTFSQALDSLAADYLCELDRLAPKLDGSRKSGDAQTVAAERARFLRALSADSDDPFEPVPELAADTVLDRPVALTTLQKSYRTERIALGTKRQTDVTAWGTTCLNAAKKRRSDPAFAKLVAELEPLLAKKNAAAALLRAAKQEVRLTPEPPAPDAPKRERTVFSAAPVAKPGGQVPAAIQAFLTEPQTFDPKWKPEIANWKYRGTADFCADGAVCGASVPSELAIAPAPANFKGYVSGVKRNGRITRGEEVFGWVGKSMNWELRDSRDLVCMTVFRTSHPAPSEDHGPAACVAVKAKGSGKLIGSIIVPLTREETKIYAAKHYTHNKLQLIWVEGRRRRSFTIPDHMPLTFHVAVVGYGAGEEIEATFVVEPSRQAMEF